MKPTLQIYGAHSPSLLERISPDYTYKLRSAGAFSPVFSFTGEAYAADAMLFFPDADMFSIFAALAEKEVDNPFMQHQYDSTRTIPDNKKPLVFLGPTEEWGHVRGLVENLKTQGVIRGDLLGKHAYFTADPVDAVQYISTHLQKSYPDGFAQHLKRKKQVRHKTYINEPDAEADFIRADSDTPKIKSAPTIAFFGSATSKQEKHHAIGVEAGRMCGQNGWNIIHGGGIAGVMGALSEGGFEAGAHVHGITASNRYAMYLSGEKDATKIIPEGQARFTVAKDMIHRIELYARGSDALSVLPGGVGTLEETFMMFELLEENHESIMYLDKNGKWHKKPMVLVNQDGIWNDLIAYYKNSTHEHLRKFFAENVKVVDTVDGPGGLNEVLSDHFKAFPPAEYAADKLDENISTSHREHIRRDPQGYFPWMGK